MIVLLALSIATAALEAEHAPEDSRMPRPLTIEEVSRLPLPGTTSPTSIGFDAPSDAISYLLPERPGENARVLRRFSPSDREPRVIARPPGGGDADGKVSLEEALRRERLRNRESGITALNRARRADVRVIPITGDLWLQRGDEPLLRLTERPEPEIDPQLSPDADRVAFVRGGELYVLDVATRSEIRLTSDAGDGRSNGLAEFMAQEEMSRSTGFWWSPDGRRIAYQHTDERAIPLFTITHDGAPKPSAETHRYPFAGTTNAAVELRVVDARGGDSRTLAIADPGFDHYLARVDWESPTHLLVQVLSRDQKSLRLERIDVDSGRRTLVLEEKSDRYVNLSDDLRILPDGGLLWTSERSGMRRIERIAADGGRTEITPANWAVDAIVGVDASRREVWFSTGADHPREMQVHRISWDGGEPVRVTKGAGTHKCTVAPDGNSYVDQYSSVDAPPVTTWFRRDGSTIAVIDDASRDPRLAGLDLARPEIVEFPASDGTKLFGAFLPPQTPAPDGRKAPLIVMLYGGPHVQYVPDAWSLTTDLRAQYLSRRGFAVWKMDNRGSARRGYAFESAVYGRLGTLEVQDQVDGLDFVAKRWGSVVDMERVGVNGRSYGGFMTLRCLVDAPDRFHAGVAEAPVTDWDGYDTCYTERYMGTPESNPSGYRESSLLGKAARLEGRLLVMHGLIDENVHFRHTARWISALIREGKGFEVLPVPEERHSSRNAANRKMEFERLVDFFERSLMRR